MQRRHPDRDWLGVRRTVERRIRHWKAIYGPERDVVFRQVHPPGREGLSDFTDASELGVVVAGPGIRLKVAPPTGDFVLDEKDDSPVVLVSGGVGLTPMMSMLEAIVASGSGRPTWYVHGAEHGRVHAMGAHARELAAKARNVTVRTFYNVPEARDGAGQGYDEHGLVTADWLRRNTLIEDAVYYLCGPRPFLRAMVGGLARSRVALDRVRYEFFGPADELLAG